MIGILSAFLFLAQNAIAHDEEEDEDEDEDEGDSDGGEKDADKEGDKEGQKDKKPYDKLASLHPDWPWYFTMLGVDRFTWWQIEALKRNQDDFDLHVYNDFTGYGMHELMENIVGHPHCLIQLQRILQVSSFFSLTLSSNPKPVTVISGLKLKDWP